MVAISFRRLLNLLFNLFKLNKIPKPVPPIALAILHSLMCPLATIRDNITFLSSKRVLSDSHGEHQQGGRGATIHVSQSESKILR